MQTLVEDAKRGDREAFDALVRIVGGSCTAIAFRILRDIDLADDAVQAAFITAWRELRSLRDTHRFEAWLHRILTRACYAEARRRRRWSAEIRVVPAANTHDQSEAGSIHDRDQLERGFRRLTLEQRAVLVFHYYLGFPVSEVADRLGISVGTVKSRLYHAKRALRASLEADDRAPYFSRERLA